MVMMRSMSVELSSQPVKVMILLFEAVSFTISPSSYMRLPSIVVPAGTISTRLLCAPSVSVRFRA